MSNAHNYARNRKSGTVVFFRGMPDVALLGSAPANWALWHRPEAADIHFHAIGEDPDMRTLRILVATTRGDVQGRAAALLAAIKAPAGLTDVERDELSKLAMANL